MRGSCVIHIMSLLRAFVLLCIGLALCNAKGIAIAGDIVSLEGAIFEGCTSIVQGGATIQVAQFVSPNPNTGVLTQTFQCELVCCHRATLTY